MLHLIKMELYRLIHTTAVWVIAIVLTVVTAAMGALLVATNSASESDLTITSSSSEYETENSNETGNKASNDTSVESEDTSISSDDLSVGPNDSGAESDDTTNDANGMNIQFYVNENVIDSTLDHNTANKIEIGLFMASLLQGGFVSIFCVIFTAIFACADQKNGYIKNLAGHFPKREQPVLAKFIAISVGVLTMMILYLAMGCLAFLIGGYQFYIDSPIELTKLLAVHLLLNLAFAAIIYLVTMLAKNSAAGITIGVLISSGITSILYSFINLVVMKIAPESTFDASQYGLDTMLINYGLSMTSNETIHAVTLGLVYGILAIGITILIAKKRDIC